jgi:hypothetical protein
MTRIWRAERLRGVVRFVVGQSGLEWFAQACRFLCLFAMENLLMSSQGIVAADGRDRFEFFLDFGTSPLQSKFGRGPVTQPTP